MTPPPSREPAPVTDAEAEEWASEVRRFSSNSAKWKNAKWVQRAGRLLADRARYQTRIASHEPAPVTDAALTQALAALDLAQVIYVERVDSYTGEDSFNQVRQHLIDFRADRFRAQQRIGKLEKTLGREHQRASLDDDEWVDVEHADPCDICALLGEAQDEE
ncbi:hypothetical protein LCGC14_0745420 [marine sediment metagenome]|uniref:Uncharacterized protein n=1 Tax=marine sediment metagenome TaxID=412755 RepID=A0A0F9Q9V6_9ZZZZ